MKTELYAAYNDGTRELSELYKMVLEEFERLNSQYKDYADINRAIVGLWLYKCKISEKEFDLLFNNLEYNKPKKYWFETILRRYIKPKEETYEQRKLFLQHLIKKYS